MKVTILSNMLNHYQLSICKAFIQKGVDFSFVATEPIPLERIKLGFDNMNDMFDFVVRAYDGCEEQQKAYCVCQNANILIAGGNDSIFQYLKNRKEDENHKTYFFSERLFKEGYLAWKTIPRFFKYFFRKSVYRNACLLCNSSYAARDYYLTRNFINKAYKWAYFCDLSDKSFDELLLEKANTEKLEILWAGRLIEWKHPETVIDVAKTLIEMNRNFSITMIGEGSMKDELTTLVASNGLNEYIKIVGSKSYNEVRKQMEKSDIFLFTSDTNEGWGVVCNEAMASGCVVIASRLAGATDYLIRNGENGIAYDGSVGGLIKAVTIVSEKKDELTSIARSAYETIERTWNAQNAVDRLIEHYNGVKTLRIDGPMCKEE